MLKLSHLHSFKETFGLLNKSEQKKSVFILFVFFFNALIEVFTLASILPFLLLLLNFFGNQDELFSSYISLNENRLIFVFVLTLVFLFLFKNWLGILIDTYKIRYSTSIAQRLAKQQFQKYFRQDYLQFNENPGSVLIKNIQLLPSEFCNHLLLSQLDSLAELCILTFLLIGILIFQPVLFMLFLIIFLPPLYFLYQLKKKRLTRIGNQIKNFHNQSTQELLSAMRNHSDIKIYDKETFFLSRFMSNYDSLLEKEENLKISNTMPSRIVEIIAIFGIFVITSFALWYQKDKQEIIFLISVFFTLSYRLLPSLNRILVNMIKIKSFQYALDILKNEEKSEPGIYPENHKKLTFNKAITIKNLQFNYPKRNGAGIFIPELTIQKGEMMGIAGKSGVGKTTFYHLLSQLIRQDQGEIYVDNTRISRENRGKWHRLLAYVSQNPVLLDTNILENSAYGQKEEEVNFSKLIEVVRQVNLSEFVDSLPDGLYQAIGENGTELSGGQIQRIAIARALYMNAEILLLDEITSNLDSDNEHEIITTLYSLIPEKTILLIAHRQSSLKYCNRIVEIDNGKVYLASDYQKVKP